MTYSRQLWHNLPMPTTDSEKLEALMDSLQDDRARATDALRVYQAAFARFQSVTTPYVPRIVSATGANEYAR